MSRFTGPRLKVMRALGVELPGLSRKSIERRPYPPGLHHQKRSGKKSTYAVQLQEKQKVRFNYGLTERQLRRTMQAAIRRKGAPGENLIALLESRLDNVVFRAGLAPTIPAARQLVNHGHVYKNGKRASIPSMRIATGDVLTVSEKASRIGYVQDCWETPSVSVPPWLERSSKELGAKVVANPTRDSIPIPIDLSKIVEFYSRRLP